MKEHLPKPESGHNHHVAEAAAVLATGFAVLGVGGFLRRRQQHTKLRTFSQDREPYKERAYAFNDPSLDQELRLDMATTAILIHNATFNAQNTYISDEALRAQLELDPDRYKTVMNRLQDYKVDDHQLSLIEANRDPETKLPNGWRATPALTWAVEEGDFLILQQAQSELLSAHASVGSYVADVEEAD